MAHSLPASLKHILAVYRLVRRNNYDRIDAVNDVAMKERISPQAVRDSCTRSIGINTNKFDFFIAAENVDRFEEHLIKRFPSYQDDIESFIDGIIERKQEINQDDPLRKLKTLFPEEQRDLLKSVLLDKLQEDFIVWLQHPDLPADIKQALEKWQKLIKQV